MAVLVTTVGLLTFGILSRAHAVPVSSIQTPTPLASCGDGGGTLTASASECVSPEGDFLTTCSGAPTPSDDTCADLIFPSGPGGFAKLTEERQGILVCRLNPLCLGSDVNVKIPAGYTDPSRPVILRIYYDASEVLLGHPRLLEQKNSGLTILLPPCLLPPNQIFPCQAGVEQLAGGDIRINALLQSGDPKFQGVIR